MSANNSPNMSGYGKLYTVIKEFNARLGDELTIKPGDTVELISDDSEFDDGWYMGKNLSTNKAGLYPKVFTTLKEQQGESKPSLLRSRSRRMTPTGSPVTPNSPSTNQFASVGEESSYDTSMNTTMDSANITSNNTSHILNNNNSNTINNSTPKNTRENGVNRYVSVHRTLNDIDRALEELNVDSNSVSNQASPLNPADVELWTPEQVTQHFSYLNFDIESAGQFARHKISGAILIQLELSYLKELDIASFGTRFEIFKEIEELKIASKNRGIKNDDSSDFKPSTPQMNQLRTNQSTTPNNVHKHMRKRSQSMDDINGLLSSKPFAPNGDLSVKSQRPVSVVPSLPRPVLPSSTSTTPTDSGSSMDDDSSSTPPPPTQPGLFESPRRAPQPPSFPSPVANQTFKFGAGSASLQHNNRSAITPLSIASHRKSFMEGAHSRDSSIGNSSSVYQDSRHTRTTSSLSYTTSNRNLSPSKGHSRNASDISVIRRDTNPTQIDRTHRRYSSLLSYSATEREHVYEKSPTRSPVRNIEVPRQFSGGDESPLKLTNTKKTILSPERRSLSAKETSTGPKAKDPKRVASAAVAPPSARSNSTSTLRTLTTRRPGKSSTSAFTEGIRTISTDEAIKTADYSGWMSKRGNMTIGSWKQRYFTLHKTRLSYYTSLKDNREKGLIDITSHRVLPAVEAEDKLSVVYAATTGSGRFCFKLVPPAPGSRKGLTFTQQKVHYFAVDTREEMRRWMGALMKATIELDESVPVISSCVTPTIPLQKAQELMAIARENARINMENIQREQENQIQLLEVSTTEEEDEGGESMKSENNSSVPTPITQPSNQFRSSTPTSAGSQSRKPSMKIDTKAGHTLDPAVNANGLSTPYLVTSGLISPNSASTSELLSPTAGRRQSLKRMPTASTNPVPMITKLDNNEQPSSPVSSSNSAAISAAVGAMGRRVMSLRKTSNGKD